MDMQPFGNMGQNWAPWNWDGFHATNGQTSKMEECLNETRDFIFLEYLQHIFGLNPYSDVNWGFWFTLTYTFKQLALFLSQSHGTQESAPKPRTFIRVVGSSYGSADMGHGYTLWLFVT